MIEICDHSQRHIIGHEQETSFGSFAVLLLLLLLPTRPFSLVKKYFFLLKFGHIQVSVPLMLLACLLGLPVSLH